MLAVKGLVLDVIPEVNLWNPFPAAISHLQRDKMCFATLVVYHQMIMTWKTRIL